MNDLQKQKVLVAVMAALVPAAVLGCGGSESSSETTVVPLTKAAYLKQGNQICEKRLDEKDEVIKATLEQLSPSERINPSSQTLEELGKSALQPIQKLTDELNELPAPVEVEAAAKKITRELKAGMKRAEADLRHLIQTDPFSKAGKAAKAYGFDACTF